MTARAVPAWRTARGAIPLDRPVVAGILNITPDSFSDGARFLAPADALRQADLLLADGADLLDLGAESTRPGASPVDTEEEWRRLEPVLAALARLERVPLTVDTVKGEIARRALEAGAWAVNDVSGLRVDPSIGVHCARAGAGVILMHSRGGVADMATYEHAQYEDVVAEVATELSEAVARAEASGVAREAIVLDPGLGFAKQPEHNYLLLAHLERIVERGFPVMVGPSRKRFLARTPDQPASDRDGATAAACAAAYERGARLFRVHNVALTRTILDAYRRPAVPPERGGVEERSA